MHYNEAYKLKFSNILILARVGHNTSRAEVILDTVKVLPVHSGTSLRVKKADASLCA